jgi:hypothetical protein
LFLIILEGPYLEKEIEEATTMIPKMGIGVVKPTEKLGEEEKVLEEIQENCKGTDPLNLFSLTKSSFLFHVKLSIGFSTLVFDFCYCEWQIFKH